MKSLILADFREFIFSAGPQENPYLEGMQIVIRFPNGFGASIVRNNISYGHEQGLVELAVIKFNGDNWELTYDTPITSDVLGNLNFSDVVLLLNQIKQL